jgi:hypothetical protein
MIIIIITTNNMIVREHDAHASMIHASYSGGEDSVEITPQWLATTTEVIRDFSRTDSGIVAHITTSSLPSALFSNHTAVNMCRLRSAQRR